MTRSTISPTISVVILASAVGTAAHAGLKLERQDAHLDALGPFVTGDIDGDTDLDVIVAVSPDDVVVLLNDGDGQLRRDTAWSESTLATPETRHSLLLADLDNDDDLDLVMTSMTDEITVRRNDGTGRFGPPETHRTDRRYVADVLGGDVDGDGDFDLLAFHSDELDVLVNDGTGAFPSVVTQETPSMMPSTATHTTVVVVDLDGDCDLDIAGFTGAAIVVLTNDGTGTFTPGERLELDFPPRSLWPADLNGDGYSDLVTIGMTVPAEGDSQCVVSAFRNDGTGAFEKRDEFFGPFLRTVAVGDVNGDERSDVSVTSMEGTLVVWTGHGDGTFADSVMLAPELRFKDRHALCDLDDNGRDDFIGPALGQSGSMLAVRLTRDTDSAPDVPALTAEDVRSMSTEEIRAELVIVARARTRAKRARDLEAQAQIESVWDLLLNEIRTRYDR